MIGMDVWPYRIAPFDSRVSFLIRPPLPPEVAKRHKYVAAAPLVIHEIDEGADAGEPTFKLTNDETQLLMDRLWDLGFRPSEGSGSAGAMAATQKHLEDMRKLVFRDTPMDIE